MLILLPPSEGKAPEGQGPRFEECHPGLLEELRPILKHTAKMKAAERQKFYSAKTPDKARDCHALNSRISQAQSIYALERYTGVVYTHIDYGTLAKKQAARKRVHIVSGLFGLIPGGARIPLYKMPINPWLARYWYDINSARLVQAAGRRKVLSLLPQAYAKAINLDGAVSVDFRVQGGKKAAGHNGKAIKGKFVRFLIENNVTNPRDFSQFREDGFQFDGENFIQG
jgi:cytoplasmic iron level regulating protein YaaA (DUF328/UPF0246 family)